MVVIVVSVQGESTPQNNTDCKSSRLFIPTEKTGLPGPFL